MYNITIKATQTNQPDNKTVIAVIDKFFLTLKYPNGFPL